MAQRTCLNCVYACWDPEAWLRCLATGEPLVPRCANHPRWPGEVHDVPGVPCRNYQPRLPEPVGDLRRIPLSKGQYALVDAADYDWLSQYKWHLCGGGYAARAEKGKRVLMHRQIMEPPDKMFVDHIDGNRANNCRANLRICTPAENQRNQRKKRDSASRFKGVGYLRNSKRCHAKLVFEGRTVWLGQFDSEPEAARAYDGAAVRYFREFARLNFPEEWPPERRQEIYDKYPLPPDEPKTAKGKPKNLLAKTPSRKGRKRATQDAQRKAKKKPARKTAKSKARTKTT